MSLLGAGVDTAVVDSAGTKRKTTARIKEGDIRGAAKSPPSLRRALPLPLKSRSKSTVRWDLSMGHEVNNIGLREFHTISEAISNLKGTLSVFQEQVSLTLAPRSTFDAAKGGARSGEAGVIRVVDGIYCYFILMSFFSRGHKASYHRALHCTTNKE